MKEEDNDNSIKFNYIKSPDFRSVLTTGVIGGITPNALIDINFFVDRVVIPKSITYGVSDVGQVLGEEVREGKDGVVREVQVGTIMDVNTAKNLVLWLQNKIEIIENLKPTK